MSDDDLAPLLGPDAAGGVVEVADRTGVAERLAAAGWTIRSLPSFSDLGGFYAAIAAELGFPSYFGKNLDALWDALRDVGDRTAVIIGWRSFVAAAPSSAARVRSVLTERAEAGPAFAVVLVDGR